VSSAARRLAALRVLCRALQGEGGPPRPVAWDEVLALAADLLVEPALWPAVHQSRAGMPAAVIERMREQNLANTVRNVRLRRALTEAVQALNASGIVPLLIKGATKLVDGTPGAAGERFMIDLDLVVPGDELEAAGAALMALGYEADRGKPFLHPHEVPFERPRSPGPIELHVELGSPPIPSVLPVAQAWGESSELSVGDARVRVLSPTHEVLHNILHSSVQDLNHAVGDLPLRQLLALSGLVRTHGHAIDWAAIYERMESHGLGAELRDHLWLAHRFAGVPLPEGKGSVASRGHEARVLATVALGWPAPVQRRLRFAFGRAYLDSLYAHGDRPLRLAVARARHAAAIIRRGWASREI
jgi:Uncharacterised nucleotidyltransferase